MPTVATDNLYSILGVAPNATQREIRDAYRSRARDMHPDKVPAADRDRASQQMAELNAAWEVLSDSVKRAKYDADRSGDSKRSEQYFPHVEPRPVSVAPAQFPWRPALFFAVVGIIVVLVLNAYASPSSPSQPDQLLQPGSCVTIDATDAVSEVRCDVAHDGVVRLLIGFDFVCPSDTEAHRDRQGMGTACVDRTLRTR